MVTPAFWVMSKFLNNESVLLSEELSQKIGIVATTNPKHEIRNNFEILNSNVLNGFEFGSFDIRICFVFRNSDFEF